MSKKKSNYNFCILETRQAMVALTSAAPPVQTALCCRSTRRPAKLHPCKSAPLTMMTWSGRASSGGMQRTNCSKRIFLGCCKQTSAIAWSKWKRTILLSTCARFLVVDRKRKKRDAKRDINKSKQCTKGPDALCYCWFVTITKKKYKYK